MGSVRGYFHGEENGQRSTLGSHLTLSLWFLTGDSSMTSPSRLITNLSTG